MSLKYVQSGGQHDGGALMDRHEGPRAGRQILRESSNYRVNSLIRNRPGPRASIGP